MRSSSPAPCAVSSRQKPEGTTLSGFADRAARYMENVPEHLARREGQCASNMSLGHQDRVSRSCRPGATVAPRVLLWYARRDTNLRIFVRPAPADPSPSSTMCSGLGLPVSTRTPRSLSRRRIRPAQISREQCHPFGLQDHCRGYGVASQQNALLATVYRSTDPGRQRHPPRTSQP